MNVREKINESILFETNKKKAGILCAEPVDEEIKIFSSVEKMEEWLLQNDFIYDQMDFFKYKEGEKEWCKKKCLCDCQ